MIEVTFQTGDTVRVHQKIQEDAKTRTQVFEGVVIGFNGRGENRTFMVRKMVGEVTVERIWPIFSPNIQKVDVKAHAKKRVRHARLQKMK